MGPASAGLRHAQTQRTPPHPRSMLAIVHEAQAASYIVKKLPHMGTCRQELLCSALLPLRHESDPRAGLLPKLDALYFFSLNHMPKARRREKQAQRWDFLGSVIRLTDPASRLQIHDEPPASAEMGEAVERRGPSRTRRGKR